MNGEYRDNTALGKLIQDFWCVDPDKMHYQELADENRRLKWTEEGIKDMNSATEKIFMEGREEGREEGNILTLYDLYNDGIISLEVAVAKAKMPEQVFLDSAKKIAKV